MHYGLKQKRANQYYKNNLISKGDIEKPQQPLGELNERPKFTLEQSLEKMRKGIALKLNITIP